METPSRSTAAERDLAVVVAEAVTHAQLMQVIWNAPTEGLLRDAVLFDVYRPKADAASAGGLSAGEKSLAVRFTLSSAEATLTDERIDAVMQSLSAALQRDLGARLRA